MGKSIKEKNPFWLCRWSAGLRQGQPPWQRDASRQWWTSLGGCCYSGCKSTCISNTRLTSALTLRYGINLKPLCPLPPAWETIPLCAFMNLLIFRVNVVTGSLCRFYMIKESSLKSDNSFLFSLFITQSIFKRLWSPFSALLVSGQALCAKQCLHSPNPPSVCRNCHSFLAVLSWAVHNNVSKILTPPRTSLSLLQTLRLVHCMPALATDYWESN